MGLKAVRFTDGTQLVLFAQYDTVYDDRFILQSNELQYYDTENVYITAGNPNGGFLNPALNGKSFTDYDGNLWNFIQTSAYNMRLTIITPDNRVYTRDMEKDSSGSNWFWWLQCNAMDTNGKYGIAVAGARPVDYYSSGSQSVKSAYIDGVNGNHTYLEDVSRVIAGQEQGNWYRCSLRNMVTEGIFISTNGLVKADYREPYIQTARVFYTEPISNGTGGTVMLYLSPDAVSDYVPPAPPSPDSDPYSTGGTSDEDGGNGDFDGTSEDINVPSLPSISASDAGFITLFNPTLYQLQNLANYMWGNSFDLDTFKKLFANPMDCILGLSMVPVNVPSSGTKVVQVGNISTGISLNVASSQYIALDCGSINVKEYWGAYLDYDPYTKAEIYLPFIGIRPIAIDDIMGKTVQIVYHIDILSGACAAYVKCGGSVLYQYIGQCSSSIPITSNDWTNVINGVISIAGAIGTVVATGGATAPMAASTIASTATNTFKSNIEKSGGMSGTGGMLAIQKPYLILTRPKQALPKRQNSFMGYPSFITCELSSLDGYTEIESIHLTGIPATDVELTEIESILKSGVIF